jgi:Protein of unknown function (DUF4013)
MDNISDSIAWPARDPQWFGKTAVMGLISLIPILGHMALFGWMLAALDSLRAGRQELPPAGFEHLARGAVLWLVLVIWSLAVSLILGALFLLGTVLASIGSNQESLLASALGVLVLMLASLVAIAFGVLYYSLQAPIMLATDRFGLAGGLGLAGVIRTGLAHPGDTIVAGLMVLVADLIGSLGLILCFIGVIFTSAYSYAAKAGILSHYERAIAGQVPALQQC